jgi:hypothetical protein
MNDTREPERDLADELLTAGSSASGNEELRQALLMNTTQVLRRRRRLRRGGFIAALAACYAAGLLTMKLLPAAAPVPNAPEVVQQPISPEGESPSPGLPTPRDIQLAEHEIIGPALALEWQAIDSTEKRPDLLRQAGQRYEEAGDLESALRCYRGALDTASEEDSPIATTDDWLLMALKEARKKEKRHAKKDG